jgi:predicted PurR-regulated permease PerM
MYALGFWISGTPLALMIGAFGLVASFVPYLGVVLTSILAISLTLLAWGIDVHLIGVLITIGLAQFLEGNVLTPKIVGDQVGLNPVWVILAVLVFGNFLGFLGLLIAVPTAAALKVLVVEAVAYYKNSKVYRGSDASG